MKIFAVFFCTLLCLPFFSHAQEAVAEATVDIAIETSSFVPSWYDGRAEPAAGAPVRAIATITGGTEGYSYRWEVNGTVLPSTESVATFTAPMGQEFRIRVDVQQNGGVAASKERIVPLSEPEIAFHESSLLYGTVQNAIDEELVLVGDEVSVRAVPYFMARDIFSGAHNTEWKLNGRTIEGNGNVRDVLTLRNEGGAGTFMVEFAARNTDSLTQYAQHAFRITF